MYLYIYIFLAGPKLIWAKWLFSFSPPARHLLVIWCALVPNRIVVTFSHFFSFCYCWPGI